MNIKSNDEIAGFYGPGRFIGLVEDRKDPQELGRVRVRMLGLHPAKDKAPTEALPWAMTSLSPNSARDMSLPREGEWVVGYFLDGTAAQQPLITGILPGINTEVVKQPAGSPVAPSYSGENKTGQPSLSLLSRAIKEGTGIEYSDNNRDHVCDVSVYIRRAMAFARIEAGDLIRAIRKAIRAVLDYLGVVPSAGGMADFLKDVARRLKELNDWIAEKLLSVAEFLDAIAEIKAIIEYILSLPAKLAAMFAQCLKEAQAELSKAIFATTKSILNEAKVGGETGLTDAFKEVTTQVKSLTQLVETTMSVPGAIVNTIADPSGYTDAEKEELVLSLFPDSSGTNHDKTTYAAKIL